MARYSTNTKCVSKCDSGASICDALPIASIEDKENFRVALIERKLKASDSCYQTPVCIPREMSIDDFKALMGNNYEERITALESVNSIVGWTLQDSNNDNIYEILATYQDGSTEAFTVLDGDTNSDTKLTNPRPQDTDGNGINDQVLWDVVDIENNVIGTEIVPIQEYVDTQSHVTSLNQSGNILTLSQQGGSDVSVSVANRFAITNIDIPADFVALTFDEKIIYSGNYVRKFSNSTLHVEAHFQTRLRVEKTQTSSDVRGFAYVDLFFGSQSKRVVENEMNTLITEDVTTGDSSFEQSSGNVSFDYSSTGNPIISVKIKIDTATQQGDPVSKYSFFTKPNAYIKITEVEN